MGWLTFDVRSVCRSKSSMEDRGKSVKYVASGLRWLRFEWSGNG
jgi:hypothetical protein